MTQDVLAEALDYSMGPERRRRLAADILVKLTRAGYALVRTPETLDGRENGAEVLDLDRDDFRDDHERAIRAHILEGPEDHRCDDLCSAAIIDRLVGKHPVNEYPPVAASSSPTPPEGLREALAEVGRWIDGLDSVSVEWAPAHTAPYVSKLVLRPGIEAIFARRLAASPAPDPGAGLREAAQEYLDTDGSGALYDAHRMLKARAALRAALGAVR